ncbi:MAG: tetratricopeptide repeat protein [Spirochaetaceae bacterium]|jgi:tetratricopeptide (TPR) repeat protein|nr:tetratricopeptide repeat protein [Spirochaetaceae bacterium]
MMNQLWNDLKNTCIVFWNKFKNACNDFFIKNEGRPFRILTGITLISAVLGIGGFQIIDKKTPAPIEDESILYVRFYEYTALTEKIEEKKKLISRIPESDMSERIQESKALQKLQDELEQFKTEVHRLDTLFQKISMKSERLQKAQEAFNRGELDTANEILNTEEMENDIRQIEASEKEIAEKREEIAQEFVVKAQTTVLLRRDNWLTEAIVLYEKAISIVDAPPVLFEYAYFLQSQNRYTQGVVYYEKALEKYRKLAEAEPEAFLPAVATTLNNLAILHRALNQHQQAEKEYTEALTIRRKLAEAQPDAFLPDVAMTLNNLANLHSDLNQHQQAEKEYKEALSIYRKFAEQSPDAFLAFVIKILKNLAALHTDMQKHELAQAELKEAEEIERRLRL